MRILSRYFVARFLGLFVTALIAALILLATVELVLNLDDLSSFSPASSSGTADEDGDVWNGSGALRFLWVRLASYYLADLLPIASFAAAFISFAWAGRAMELVATQAGGIRLIRLVMPVLTTALILSFAAAILHETVILRANQIWHQQVGNAGEAIDFGREAFWYHNGRVITNITKADAETRTLHGVEIFERNAGGEIERVVRADRVRIDADGLWQIEAAEIWSFDPSDASAPPTFESGARVVLDLESLRGNALLGAAPKLLPLPSLARYLESQPTDSSRSHRRLANLYHERLSQPWLVLLFAFLALPFGLRVDATGRIVPPAVAAACVLGLFFFLRSAGVALSQQEILPVGLSQWYSIGAFALVAALALRRTGS